MPPQILTDEEKRVILARWRAIRTKYAKEDSRLSIPYIWRLPLGTTLAFLGGLMIGTSHGSTLTGLRYRAENAHRLPNTTSGWYLYHKTKNYEMAWGGLREGVKLGFKVAFWTAGFFGIENSIDQCRGSKDVLSTVLASLSVAGGFSLWNQFAMVEAVRTAKQALAIGLAYGFTQDALGYMRGRKLGYVDFLLRSRRGNAKLEGSTTT